MALSILREREAASSRKSRRYVGTVLSFTSKARTIADIGFSLGRAERQIHRIAEIELSGDGEEFWDKEQARLMRLIKRLRSS